LVLPHLYINAAALKLRNHGVQISHSEVDHPLLLAPAEVFRVVLERTEHGGSTALLPDSIRNIYAEMVCVPTRQSFRILRAKEYPADAQDFLHLSSEVPNHPGQAWNRPCARSRASSTPISYGL